MPKGVIAESRGMWTGVGRLGSRSAGVGAEMNLQQHEDQHTVKLTGA